MSKDLNLFDSDLADKNEENQKIFSVSQYLDSVNFLLKAKKAKVLGEVFGIQEYPGRSYLYFSVKDKEDSSTIKCFMWKKDYLNSGVLLQEGMEVVVYCYPAIYKPNGGLSLQIESIELLGEGALKIAYEKLKQKLQSEGLFDQQNKRPIPEFPKKIGIITSKSGAVINDFLSNISKWGFELLFVDSKVEGEGAVKDLLSALRVLYKEKVDCLVLMRGGGSLESFQAFNNENIVRAICKFNAPVITGIGHDKDVPLVCLASDKNVSTPTAVANLLGVNFLQAKNNLELDAQNIFNSFENLLKDKTFLAEEALSVIWSKLENILYNFEKLILKFVSIPDLILEKINNINLNIDNTYLNLFKGLQKDILLKDDKISNYQKQLSAFDPKKRLSQGYSIVRFSGKIIKSSKNIKSGDNIGVELADGFINTEVI